MAVPTLVRYAGPDLAVSDNQGNLPIHLAAICPARPTAGTCWKGSPYLLAEADWQVEEKWLRFRQTCPRPWKTAKRLIPKPRRTLKAKLPIV
jgi:hypothetical protein